MRILVCFEGRVRPDSTGFYILWAFQSLGHEVTHVTPDKIHEVRPGGHDFYFRCDDGLKELGWNKYLRPSHFFCIDTHVEYDWRLELAKDFDTVSVVHSSGLGLPWGRTVEKDLFFVPVACDPEKHDVGKREKIYDGCAIMNFHNGMAGPRIEALDAFFKVCPGKIFFGGRTFRDMAEKYAQSKLIFNRSINGSGGEGANMRVFEAMCSGSCLVTDRVTDLDKLGFRDGIHYAGYSSGEELSAIVKDLLADEARRERIAAAGRAEVIAKHTYAHRMTALIKNLKEKEIPCLH